MIPRRWNVVRYATGYLFSLFLGALSDIADISQEWGT